MAVNVRADGDLVILSNFGGLMNDPRHFDVSRDVQELLDQGCRKFVLELRGVGELGASGVGLLVTITRLIRKNGGEVVVARPSKAMVGTIAEMQLDDYWDCFEDVQDAKAALGTE